MLFVMFILIVEREMLIYVLKVISMVRIVINCNVLDCFDNLV